MAVRDGLHITTPAVAVIENTKKTPLPYVRHTVTFTMRTTYSKFKAYLHDLEGNLSLRDISSLSFNSQETDQDALEYRSPELVPHSYSVTLVTYSLH